MIAATIFVYPAFRAQQWFLVVVGRTSVRRKRSDCIRKENVRFASCVRGGENLAVAQSRSDDRTVIISVFCAAFRLEDRDGRESEGSLHQRRGQCFVVRWREGRRKTRSSMEFFLAERSLDLLRGYVPEE